MITTVENARHVNALKEAVKSSYSEIGDKLSQAATYLNTQETDKLDKEDIVVIRVKKEEAIEYTRLFRIYKKHGQINEQAQKEAKNVMGVLPN